MLNSIRFVYRFALGRRCADLKHALLGDVVVALVRVMNEASWSAHFILVGVRVVAYLHMGLSSFRGEVSQPHIFCFLFVMCGQRNG